ncbi:MAG: DUF2378 family protein [Myxococcaceae bacterium]|nr:DUF2378 family protein [Myxococcaceae bacterium]
MDSRELFQRRAARAMPQDQILGVFIEGTITSLSEEFSPAVEEAVRKAQQRAKGWTPFFRYPAAEWLQLMDVAATTAMRESRVSYGKALERMGQGVGRYMFRTPLAKTFHTLVGKDPQRMVSTSVFSAKAVCTWGNRQYEKVSPTQARLRLRDEFMGPEWVQGFYRELFRLSPGVSPSSTVEDYEEPGMYFAVRFSW